MEENPPMEMKNVAAAIGLVILLAGALAVFVKKQKEPPKSTAESVSDVEELEEEDDLNDDFEEEITEIIQEDDKEGMPL